MLTRGPACHAYGLGVWELWQFKARVWGFVFGWNLKFGGLVWLRVLGASGSHGSVYMGLAGSSVLGMRVQNLKP